MGRAAVAAIVLCVTAGGLTACGDDAADPPVPTTFGPPTEPADDGDPPGSAPPVEADDPDGDDPDGGDPTPPEATTVPPPRDPDDPGYPEVEPRPGVTYPSTPPG